jgi:hypothetical protein
MTQNELLPIGTRLITNNLEIAAGLVKRFGCEVQIKNCPENPFKKIQYYLTDWYLELGYKKACYTIFTQYFLKGGASIIVTENNQRLFSDVPIIGDKIERGRRDCQNGVTQTILSEKDILRAVAQSDYVNIINRFYPFADKNLTPITTSMFDEIIEPERQGE